RADLRARVTRGRAVHAERSRSAEAAHARRGVPGRAWDGGALRWRAARYARTRIVRLRRRRSAASVRGPLVRLRAVGLLLRGGSGHLDPVEPPRRLREDPPPRR